MHLPLLTLVFLSLSSCTLARQALSDATSFAAMLERGDSLIKRQSGYYPDTTSCGLGDTCEEACGPNQVECPSNSAFTLYCHSSVDGSACCPDLSGYSCRAGFYCTSDGRGRTYCCPNGVDTAGCARQYSLTVSLIRQSSTAVFVPSVSVSSGAQVVTPATTPATVLTSVARNSTMASMSRSSTPAGVSSPAGVSTPAGSSTPVVGTSTPVVVPTPSSVFTPPPLPTFTGGAVRNVGGGIVAFIGAGIALL